MRSLITIVIFIFICSPLRGQSVRIQLEDCNLTNEEFDDISKSLLFQENLFKVIFGKSLEHEIGAMVLRDEPAFYRYSKQQLNYNPRKHNFAAYFDPEVNRIVIHKDMRFAPVFRHELSHGLYSMYCENAPRWLEEGLAELVEDIYLFEESKYVFDNKAYSAKYHYLKDNVPADQIIGIVRDDKSFDKVENSYQKAWAVVNYLYREKPQMLFEIIRESCDIPYEAVERTYPGGARTLSADLQAFYLLNSN